MLRLPSNFYVWYSAKDDELPARPRLMTPLVGCDFCQRPISNGNSAHVLLADDLEIEAAHPAHPVIVHADCLDAFHELHPTRWLVWGTVREFLQQLTLSTNVDEIKRERAATAAGKKAKGKDGFAA